MSTKARPECHPDLKWVDFYLSLNEEFIPHNPAEPVVVRQCQLVYLTERIRNRVNRANQSTVQLYFSPTPEPCWQTEWDEHEISAFEGREEITFVHTPRIPADAKVGETYYIIATIGHGIDEESGGHNNNRSESIAVKIRIEPSTCANETSLGGAESDLMPHESSFTSDDNGTVTRGTSLYIYSVTTNQRPGSATTSTTKIYLTPSTNFPPSEAYWWYNHSVGYLAGNKCTTNASYKTIPASLGAGTHHIIAVCASPGGSQCTTPPGACTTNDTQIIEQLNLQ